MEKLREKIKKLGERLPKKHGEWYRLNIWGNNYLVLDTWNGHVYHHKGCIPSDTDNMYRVVYTFTGYVGSVGKDMINFWKIHIDRSMVNNKEIPLIEG